MPARHGARPLASPPSLLEEPVATHAEVVAGRLVGCDLGQRHEPLLLLRAPPRTVAEDRVDPRPERRSPLEPVEAADDVQPCLLNHLVGYRTARDERHRNPRHRRRVTANKRAEDLLVSVPQLGEDDLLRALGRDGARPDHGPTVARNTRARRVSTVGMPASTRDDHALLAACADGDEQALAALYDRFGRVAYRLALRVLRDSALAEDAVQDAFLAVWRQAAKFDPLADGRRPGSSLSCTDGLSTSCARQANFNALSDQLEVIEASGIRRRERRQRCRASRDARRGSGCAGNAVEGRARSPRPRLLGRPDPVGDRDRAPYSDRDGEEPNVQRSGTPPRSAGVRGGECGVLTGTRPTSQRRRSRISSTRHGRRGRRPARR